MFTRLLLPKVLCLFTFSFLEKGRGRELAPALRRPGRGRGVLIAFETTPPPHRR